MEKLEALRVPPLSRRLFLAGLGGSAAALAIGGCTDSMSTPAPPKSSTTTTVTDTDILNFALNLEYLEAEFYLLATTGAGLSDADSGSGAGSVTGGAQVPFKTPEIQEFAMEIANDELAHVRDLRKALGSAAVSRPPLDFSNSFNAAAQAAGIGSTFNPFADEDSFLLGAFTFEDVGVTAYHGAAPLIGNTTILEAAGAILAVEAYHAGGIRTLIVKLGGAYVTNANKISALRAAAGGGNETPLSPTTIVAADSNSIAYDRTPSEVLHIVYLNPQPGVIKSGGFFPNGLNGNISATASYGGRTVMTEAMHTTEGREYSRRAAFAVGSAAVAGLAFSARATAQTTTNTITDQDILNFALNLEYLEAEYYTLATTGKTIDQVGIGITGGVYGSTVGTVTVKSNPMVPFSDSLLKQFAMELATDEQNHVKFLRAALGSSVAAQPNIDLENSFNALAMAAGLGSSFDPFASDANFLLGAFIFEDVGVTAYLGAAGLLSNKTFLDKAAGIMAVEAYHAASIRERIFAAGTTAQQAATAIAKTRATLDGTGNDDIGVGVQNGTATIVDADPSTGMAFSRTAAQVLKIVYGGGTSGGAFFPNGVNGPIV